MSSVTDAPRASIWGYYRFPTFTSIGILALVVWYAIETNNLSAIPIVLLLATLETSLSFDNALVNAKYVRQLSPQWQQRFLKWGILIAVIGMRFLFPILIVSVTALISPWSVVQMAIQEPEAYATHLLSAHIPLVVFGGLYLLQIALNFFLNAEEKDATWLWGIEHALEWVGAKSRKPLIMSLILSLITLGVLARHWIEEWQTVVIYGLASIALFQLVSFIGNKLDGDEDDDEDEASAAAKVAAQAARNLTGRPAAFVFGYLEIQDAMFSFDGILGAFAFTSLIVLIMAGNGIGALYVRGMTIHLVKVGALETFRYLGNGAYWAIAVLPFSMWFEFPEWLTGVLSVALIVAAFVHSVLANRKDMRDGVRDEVATATSATGEPVNIEDLMSDRNRNALPNEAR